MATYSEKYCDPVNGSNNSAGSSNAAPTMTDTAGTGGWVSTTQIYTSTSTTGTVAVGQFLSIYSGAGPATTIARITAVSGGSGSAWVITVSNAAYAGTQPSALTTGATYKAAVDGYWLGPNGASGFPLNLTNLAALADASGDPVRVTMKNGATYSITAGITVVAGPLTIQGATSSADDLGRFTLDGGNPGTSFIMLTGGAQLTLRDAIIQNNGNGSSGNANAINAGSRNLFERVTVNNVRGIGINFSIGQCIECEAYSCNGSNTATTGGFASGAGCDFVRCTAHHNTGSNSSGFVLTVGARFIDCIAADNGAHGISVNANSVGFTLLGCTTRNNTGDGVHLAGANSVYMLENCQHISNSGYGINMAGTVGQVRITNNGYYGNTSGQTNGLTQQGYEIGAITYGSDPTVDGANGNFAVNLAAAEAAGRGNFELASAKYSKSTTSFPDVGAVQNSDTTTAGLMRVGGMSGGCNG